MRDPAAERYTQSIIRREYDGRRSETSSSFKWCRNRSVLHLQKYDEILNRMQLLGEWESIQAGTSDIWSAGCSHGVLADSEASVEKAGGSANIVDTWVNEFIASRTCTQVYVA